MKTQTLYLIPGTKTREPFASFDKDELTERCAHLHYGEIHSLEARGDTSGYPDGLLPGLGHMARNLLRDGKKFDLDLELHLEFQDREGVIVITRGKAELLKAIKDAYDQGPTYATGILTRETINFGSMLDLDIAIGHALKNRAEKAKLIEAQSGDGLNRDSYDRERSS